MASLLLNPIRYFLSASLRTVFQPDVRDNPVVLNANRQSDDGSFRNKEQRRGFSPQYAVPLKRPRTSFEAQRLYNHIRTVSWYLDAIPFLGRQLPFNIGVDSIIGLIPGLGDYIGVLLSLYALFLSCLFGLPLDVIGFMLFNIILDCVLGLVPLIGDALDVAFKANLRNLRLLEDHLEKNKGVCGAGRFSLTFPPTNRFLPPDSPQAARGAAMPVVDEAESRSWRSTRGNQTGAAPMSDFRNGATGSEAPPVAPKDVPRGTGAARANYTKIIAKKEEGEAGPDHVFTTMRYDSNGATVDDLIPPQLSGKALNDKARQKDFKGLEDQIPLFSRHIGRIVEARKAMQAHYSGWRGKSTSEVALSNALEAALKERLSSERGLRRVRLALDREGKIEVTVSPMAGSMSKEAPLVRINPEAVDGHIADVLQYKTSSRRAYDEARERVGATLGIPNAIVSDPCFDALLCQGRRGRGDSEKKRLLLTESSIANIVVEYMRPHVFYTPKANSSSLFLCGLMRAELLDRGLIQEADLYADEVIDMVRKTQARLWLCNALRGAFPVQLQVVNWQYTVAVGGHI